MDNHLREETQPSSEALREIRRKKFWKEVREWVVSMAAALLAVLVLRSFVFTMIRVDGSSMSPTLANGERLFVSVAEARFGSIHRDDVVICRYPNRGRTNFVKRVVAVPGDSVYRQDGVTHVVYATDSAEICDVALDPDRLNPLVGESSDYDAYVLGEDEYFVVGDNRYSSHDSRDWNDTNPDMDVGPITRDMITGCVRQVIWPPESFRTVK